MFWSTDFESQMKEIKAKCAWGDLNLDQCTALKLLIINYRPSSKNQPREPSESAQAMWNTALGILPNAPAHLERVTLMFELKKPMDVSFVDKRIDWMGLERLLWPFKHLKVVSLMFCEIDKETGRSESLELEASSLLRRRLSSFHEDGRLRFI